MDPALLSYLAGNFILFFANVQVQRNRETDHPNRLGSQ